MFRFQGFGGHGDFETALPGQFVEVGIAEQDAIGIAAGLSRCGKTVFVCGPASFYAARSLDQVKVDVAYADRTSRSSGSRRRELRGPGKHPSFTARHRRDAGLPGLEVFLPCDAASTAAVTDYMAGSEGPPTCASAGKRCPRYTAALPIPARARTSCAMATIAPFIAVGEMVKPALDAADLLLQQGIKARVLDCWSINPSTKRPSRRPRGKRASSSPWRNTASMAAPAPPSPRSSCRLPPSHEDPGFPDEWAPAGSSAELFAHYG